jgi:hypothetical protein
MYICRKGVLVLRRRPTVCTLTQVTPHALELRVQLKMSLVTVVHLRRSKGLFEDIRCYCCVRMQEAQLSEGLGIVCAARHMLV